MYAIWHMHTLYDLLVMMFIIDRQCNVAPLYLTAGATVRLSHQLVAPLSTVR